MIANKIEDPEKLVQRYVNDVLSGERATGRHEQYAVKRYVDDLEHAAERGFYLDKEYAAIAVQFFPSVLRHSIGQWVGEPFELDPWQAFCVWNIQGWRKAETKLRRFRRAYISVGRKNGKTTLAAGMALQLLFADMPFEAGGRGYCAATKRAQANLLWSEAARMIKSTTWLNNKVRLYNENSQNGGRIVITHSKWKQATFETVGSDSKYTSGLNPSFVIKDELHEWRNHHRGLHEKLSTGGASRRQPIEIVITTAGDDNSEIWTEEDEYARKVLASAGAEQSFDDSLFALICELDEDDDPLEAVNWPKANPNWNVSVNPEYIEQQATEAVAKPSSYNSFLRYHCNRRVAAFHQAYPDHIWKRGSGTFDEPEEQSLCFAAFDLGRANDWASVAVVWPQKITDGDGETNWRYCIRTKTWCCAGASSKTDYSREPYWSWISNDLLQFQSGEIIDFYALKEYILRLNSDYVLKSCPYDKTFAQEVAADLYNTYSVPVIEVPQYHSFYNEPIRSFEKALLEGRILHANDPVLNFQAGNAELVYDARGRCMLDKGNQQAWKKIDAMVALLMAYQAAIMHTKAEKNNNVLIM